MLSTFGNSVVDGLRTFFESSTIHGLIYISTTRKWIIKIFWIVVVIAGFTGASIMIYESFKDWDENPVKTTIETLPITEMKLPIVTVCPPKNTFTDLNYDLMMTQNNSFDNETRDELINYATELLNNDFHEGIMTNLSMLVEKDRYYNWYNGYTKMQLPYFMYIERKNSFDFMHRISTAANIGTIWTKNFGQKFEAEKVTRQLDYIVQINQHKSVSNNPNATLHIEVEKVSMKVQYREKFFVGTASLSLFAEDKDMDKAHITKNITKPGRSIPRIRLSRGVTLTDVKDQRLDLMPGFRASWYYSGMEVQSYDGYFDKDDTKSFIRHIVSFNLWYF